MKRNNLFSNIFLRSRQAVLVALATFAVAILTGCGGGDGEKIVWDDIVLGSVIPEPPSGRGQVIENSDEALSLSLVDVSDKDYQSYYDSCVEMGFDVDADKSSSAYEAYNPDGYCLDMDHIGEDLTIRLTCPKEYSAIEWPSGTAGSLLPAPKSTTGEFSYERDDGFYVEVGDTGKADYDEYVSACADKGFNVDYDKGDGYYEASNADGWKLSLNYMGNNVMSVEIEAPEEKPAEEDKEAPDAATEEADAEETVTEDADAAEEATDASDEASDEAAEEASDEAEADGESGGSGLRPEFKEAMDSYEAFMDEYVAFMKKYDENPSDTALLADYAEYMSKYAEFVEDFEKWEDSDMNAEETAYYIEVQSRVSQKLIEAGQSAG